MLEQSGVALDTYARNSDHKPLLINGRSSALVNAGEIGVIAIFPICDISPELVSYCRVYGNLGSQDRRYI